MAGTLGRKMRGHGFAALLLALWLPNAGTAESMVRHGPFHFDRIDPGVIYMSGPIEVRTGLHFQRILDASGVARELVLDSGGGLVHTALPMAIEVRRRGLHTRVPEGAICFSACSFLWFAGVRRFADGAVGVHQLAMSSPDLAFGQVAIADIVDVLSGFGVPSEVLVRMLLTPAAEMDVLSPEDLRDYGLLDPVPVFVTVPLQLDDDPPRDSRPGGLLPPELLFPAPEAPVADPAPAPPPAPPPSLPERLRDMDQAALLPLLEVLRQQPEGAVPEPAPDVPVPDVPVPEAAPAPERLAVAFLARNTSDWSEPNATALARIAEDYADEVLFYGSPHSHAEVMADKRAFARRWPVRDYALDPDTARADCDAARCIVTGEILWDARSPERGAVSRGRSRIEVTLSREGEGFRITAEGGRVIERY